MIIAQISDLHIKEPGRLAYGVVDTAPYLERAVAKLNALDPQPDLVIASGDLVDSGSDTEYRRLRALLAPLRAPVYVIAGNHDDRAALKRAFADHAQMAPFIAGSDDHLPLQYVVEGALRMIALDSTIPGEEGGELDDARLTWFAQRLDEDTKTPTLVVLHHPPFRSGIEHMDERGLRNAQGFGDIIACAPNVERIACGHLHRSMHVRWRGTLAVVAPSVAHQLVLELRPQQPLMFDLEPPALLLHVETGGLLVTHLVPIDDAPGPYPFHRDGQLIDV